MANTRYNETLFARANSMALKNRAENESLRSIYFLEGYNQNKATFKVEYSNLETGEYREAEILVEVKPLNFEQQLEEATILGISPTDLKIAQEVDSWGANANDFETICALVHETYMDTDVENDIWECTKVILSLYRNGYSLKEIEQMTSWERVDTSEELC